ncbi:DUF3568 family protein [Pseudodesulfovibrio sp. F-1]|uniref:DUF3568 family protein n=1 Tax=Pseudodesulfovibrio alkaliphilus TaxID=2661613 RepID=A0A7K1KN95_9BACT|nr:DUF3568 family protein [Pseudodesulfovibrio alkaliphilus]MUM77558.1 DUF3568 family protein [Pseudodesulfovibrio alkaliphilus]
MPPITRAVATALLLVTLLGSAGCGAILLGGAAAAGTYVYFDGQAKNTYNASFQKAYDASLAACRELTIPVTSETRDGTSGKITGKLSGDTVIISLKLVGDNLTEITVRVGLIGNESASRRIHATISRHL